MANPKADEDLDRNAEAAQLPRNVRLEGIRQICSYLMHEHEHVTCAELRDWVSIWLDAFCPVPEARATEEVAPSFSRPPVPMRDVDEIARYVGIAPERVRALFGVLAMVAPSDEQAAGKAERAKECGELLETVRLERAVLRERGVTQFVLSDAEWHSTLDKLAAKLGVKP